MKIIFRINNPEFGILHLKQADNPTIDLKSVSTVEMMPKACQYGFLRSKGLAQGDPVNVEFDDQHQIVAIHQMDGMLLWSA